MKERSKNEVKINSVEVNNDEYVVKVAGLEVVLDETDPRSTQALQSLQLLAREEARSGK